MKAEFTAQFLDILHLYQEGQNERADSICLAIRELGSLALKEIYNRNN